MAREIIKKRVGPDGVEVDCESEPDRYVDIKEIKKTKYERGRGAAYQKTIYEHVNPAIIREYDDQPKITFKNPNNESQTIEYLKTKGDNHGTIKSIRIEAGKGAYYQKTKLVFRNSADDTTRKVREQRVENEDNPSQYIMVERITEWVNEWGKGARYQKKRVKLCNSEEEIAAQEGDCKPT